MALGFYFTPQSFTVEQYDEVIRRLEAAGAGSPPGRSSFDKFGETLIPIMAELGTDPGEPQVAEIHNVIIR